MRYCKCKHGEYYHLFQDLGAQGCIRCDCKEFIDRHKT